MKAHRLRNLRVKRVDLVDQGANFDLTTGEGAHVLLYKAADMVACKGCGKPMTKGGTCKACGYRMEKDMKIDLSKLSAEDKAAVEKALADAEKLAAAEKRAADAETAKQAAEEALAKSKDKPATPPEPKPEDVLKNADPAVKALVEALTTRVTKAEETATKNATEVAKLLDERRLESFLKEAEAFTHLPNAPKDEVAKLLKSLNDKAPEALEQVKKIFGAASEAIEAGAMFTEIGGNGAGSGSGESAVAKVNAMIADKVTKKLAKDGVEAIALIMRENPRLYEQYRRETAVRV